MGETTLAREDFATVRDQGARTWWIHAGDAESRDARPGAPEPAQPEGER